MVNRENERDMSRSERMLVLLGNIDEDILSEAMESDCREKLITKREKSRVNCKKRAGVIRYSLVAACLVLAVSIVPILRCLQGAKENDRNVLGEILLLPAINGDVKITSGDEWNYFAARMALTEKFNAKGGDSVTVSNTGDGCIFTFLGNGNDTKGSNDNKNETLYYDMGHLESLDIVTVTYFTVEFTEKQGYLGSRFYGENVEVVITEMANFESMITFRCDDEYFSCLENGLDEFSTHKYIDGFNVVKSFGDEDIFSYYIDRDKNGKISGMHLQRQNSIYYLSDKIKLVADVVSVEVNCSYSIADLEKYFNQKTAAS